MFGTSADVNELIKALHIDLTFLTHSELHINVQNRTALRILIMFAKPHLALEAMKKINLNAISKEKNPFSSLISGILTTVSADLLLTGKDSLPFFQSSIREFNNVQRS